MPSADHQRQEEKVDHNSPLLRRGSRRFAADGS
jgi:hypothetical protein